MKIKIYSVDVFTTTFTRDEIIIDTDNYPELEGMSEDDISNYIDNNIWDMKPVNDGIYDSLGEEVTYQTPIDEDIEDTSSEYFIEEITE